MQTQSAKILIFPKDATARRVMQTSKRRGYKLCADHKASYTTQPLHPGNDAA